MTQFDKNNFCVNVQNEKDSPLLPKFKEWLSEKSLFGFSWVETHYGICNGITMNFEISELPLPPLYTLAQLSVHMPEIWGDAVQIRIGDTVVTERFEDKTEGVSWNEQLLQWVGEPQVVREIINNKHWKGYMMQNGGCWPVSAVRLVPPDEQAQQWKPEWGKEYEFSDNTDKWEVATFISINPVKESSFKYLAVTKIGIPYGFNAIRPILTLSDKIQAEVIKSLTIAYEAGDNNCEMGGNSGTDLKVILDTVAPKLTQQILKVVEGERDLRPVVRWFAEQMENQLKANDHKGGWDVSDPDSLFDRISGEANELEEELKNINSTKLNKIKEAADVANFAMMVADCFGEQYGE